MAAAFRTFHQGGEDGRTWDRKGTLSAGLTVIFSGLGAAAGVWQTSAVSQLGKFCQFSTGLLDEAPRSTKAFHVRWGEAAGKQAESNSPHFNGASCWPIVEWH